MDGKDLTQKIEKRAEEIQTILDDFVEQENSDELNVKIGLIENAAVAISTIYHHILYENVKGKFFDPNGLINKFKVASISEISAMLVSPIRVKDYGFQDENDTFFRLINAKASNLLGYQLMRLIYKAETGKDLGLPSTTILINSIVNHVQWVRFFEHSKAYETYLNATFWEMFFCALILEQKQ